MRSGRRNAVATDATCPLSQPHPLADAVILSCELAKASSPGEGWGEGSCNDLPALLAPLPVSGCASAKRRQAFFASSGFSPSALCKGCRGPVLRAGSPIFCLSSTKRWGTRRKRSSFDACLHPGSSACASPNPSLRPKTWNGSRSSFWTCFARACNRAAGRPALRGQLFQMRRQRERKLFRPPCPSVTPPASSVSSGRSWV